MSSARDNNGVAFLLALLVQMPNELLKAAKCFVNGSGDKLSQSKQ
jgi:hypothetical protein